MDAFDSNPDTNFTYTLFGEICKGMLIFGDRLQQFDHRLATLMPWRLEDLSRVFYCNIYTAVPVVLVLGACATAKDHTEKLPKAYFEKDSNRSAHFHGSIRNLPHRLHTTIRSEESAALFSKLARHFFQGSRTGDRVPSEVVLAHWSSCIAYLVYVPVASFFVFVFLLFFPATLEL